MNGEIYLLDTNAIIALLQGNKQLIQYLCNAQWIGISIIAATAIQYNSSLITSDSQFRRIKELNVIDFTE